MKNIGKYNGIPCYECTNEEWKECYDKGRDNGKQIFIIIDGVMVCKNKIVGHYDGQHVKDRYDEQPYYVEVKVDNGDVMQFRQKKATFTAKNSKWDEEFVEEVRAAREGRSGTTVAASYEELVKQDIDFGKYSTVVDQFFALLEM